MSTAADPLKEIIFIADTGNNRVVKFEFPLAGPAPDTVWSGMKQDILLGNTEAALTRFARTSQQKYRQSYAAMGSTETVALMNAIGTLTAEVLNVEFARYRFQIDHFGQPVTFYVNFVRENGQWKILDY